MHLLFSNNRRGLSTSRVSSFGMSGQSSFTAALGEGHFHTKELRQASPLTGALPPEARQRILEEVQRLRKGIPLGPASASALVGSDGDLWIET
jgi:hypothetical protein